ncbi:MAG: hypothetical protein ACKO5C_00815 [Ferruginibacter sp.]
MKTFTIITESSMWSTKQLIKKVEATLAQKSAEGFEVVSVTFSYSVWGIPTAYITLAK